MLECPSVLQSSHMQGGEQCSTAEPLAVDFDHPGMESNVDIMASSTASESGLLRSTSRHLTQLKPGQAVKS